MEGEDEFILYLNDLVSPKTRLDSGSHGSHGNPVENMIEAYTANHPHSYGTVGDIIFR